MSPKSLEDILCVNSKLGGLFDFLNNKLPSEAKDFDKSDISKLKTELGYIPMRRNRYCDGFHKKSYPPLVESCDCENICDDNCYNRSQHIECNPDICHLPPSKCTNRLFTNHHQKFLSVKECGLKGRGLFANEDIDDNEYIIEYVGEIIDDKE